MRDAFEPKVVAYIQSKSPHNPGSRSWGDGSAVKELPLRSSRLGCRSQDPYKILGRRGAERSQDCCSCLRTVVIQMPSEYTLHVQCFSCMASFFPSHSQVDFCEGLSESHRLHREEDRASLPHGTVTSTPYFLLLLLLLSLFSRGAPGMIAFVFIPPPPSPHEYFS